MFETLNTTSYEIFMDSSNTDWVEIRSIWMTNLYSIFKYNKWDFVWYDQGFGSDLDQLN
jgi:hypothetical protein